MSIQDRKDAPGAALITELAASFVGRTILSVLNTTRTGLSVLLADSAIKAAAPLGRKTKTAKDQNGATPKLTLRVTEVLPFA